MTTPGGALPQVSGPAGTQSVRRHNRTLVLQELAVGIPRSRAQLAATTDLTRATVSALVDALLEEGLVEELEPSPGGRGRPGNPVQLRAAGATGLGLEINVDYLAAAVVDLSGRVIGRRILPLDVASMAPATVVARAGRLGVDLLAGRTPTGVGLALPGLVDPAGTLRRAPNLVRFEGLDAAAALHREIPWDDLTIGVANEADLAALAQCWYGGGPSTLVHVSGEIGVGAGIVVDGALMRGSHGFAGELGHVVVDPHGPPCSCGGAGCLEQFAGLSVILDRAGVPDLDTLVAAASRGDRSVLAALATAASALGIALAGAVNLLDLPAVVLGGVYGRLGDFLAAAVRAQLTRRVVSSELHHVQVLVSPLGRDAAVRGAAGRVVQDVILGR